ncbi:hypothetical protein ABE10_01970, partial [Bacillus toyonensis]|nr:hypothetical protein [Bacillus toyonensis]
MVGRTETAEVADLCPAALRMVVVVVDLASSRSASAAREPAVPIACAQEPAHLCRRRIGVGADRHPVCV